MTKFYLYSNLYIGMEDEGDSYITFHLVDNYNNHVNGGFLFSISSDGYVGNSWISQTKGFDLDTSHSLKIIGVDIYEYF